MRTKEKNSDRINVHLILEGNEEKVFFDIFQSTLEEKRAIKLTLKNAGCASNIAPFFQEAISNEEYDAVFCVYDVDCKQNEKNSPFLLVRKDLKEILGNDTNTDIVSLCTNPNILQMILLTCKPLCDVELKKTSKSANTPFVNKCWPKIGSQKQNKNGQKISADYDAKEWQLTIIKDSFLYESETYRFDDIYKNAIALSMHYHKDIPSSNIIPFLEAIKKENRSFFDKNYSLIKCLIY